MVDYAIVQTGGKQYRVQPGDTVRVESLRGDEGDTVEFDRILMVSDEGRVIVGNPNIPGAKVTAEIVTQGRDDKIIVFKYKAKTRYRRKNGHRQPFTDLKVTEISVDGRPTEEGKSSGA